MAQGCFPRSGLAALHLAGQPAGAVCPASLPARKSVWGKHQEAGTSGPASGLPLFFIISGGKKNRKTRLNSFAGFPLKARFFNPPL